MTDKELLFYHCNKVRLGIEKCQSEYDIFKRYPKGYCCVASIWLYEFLRSKGYNNISVREYDPFCERSNHVWLNYDKYSIDITGDQFEGANIPRVYIGENHIDELEYYRYYRLSSYEEKFSLEYENYQRYKYFMSYEKRDIFEERRLLYEQLDLTPRTITFKD